VIVEIGLEFLKMDSWSDVYPCIREDIATWVASTFENSPVGALVYLKHRMFVLKDMVPISSPRKMTRKAYMYWRYRNTVILPSATPVGAALSCDKEDSISRGDASIYQATQIL
jgi:hypothetical protein